MNYGKYIHIYENVSPISVVSFYALKPVSHHHLVYPVSDALLNIMLSLICYQVQNLSGGELQRVAITLCLGQPADVYLIDEPSAYLDSEQRLHAAKVIRR